MQTQQVEQVQLNDLLVQVKLTGQKQESVQLRQTKRAEAKSNPQNINKVQKQRGTTTGNSKAVTKAQDELATDEGSARMLTRQRR